MTRLGKGASLTVFGLLVCGGCQPKEEAGDEFRMGVPRQETVTMQVPAAAGQALEVESTAQALKGQTAELYRTTRDVARLVNGGVAFVKVLVDEVVKHPPTTATADEAVWGPFAAPLEPVRWRVTIRKAGADSYNYSFDGQDKRNAAGPFVPVLFGAHTPARDGAGQAIEGYGTGHFTIDWDARQTLPVPGREVGKAIYDYSRTMDGKARIAAKFLQVRDDDHPDRRNDLDYVYGAEKGQGGSLEFVVTAPAALDNAGGKLAVRSRWKESGAGRSDARAKSNDPGKPIEWTECWDAAFASTFVKASLPFTPEYGTEAVDCVFPTAEAPTLAF